MRVSVIGDDAFCLGFRLAGVNTTHEMAADETDDHIDDIMADEEGVLIVAGDHMNTLSERKRLELQNSVDPVVIPISEESQDEDLRSKIKQAIGVDIWSE